MAIDKRQICVIRSLSRYPGGAQRDALAGCGCGDWHDLAERGARTRLLDTLRRGDTVHVRNLHLIAEPKRQTNDNPRLDLWWIVQQIEARGVVIVELSTGFRSDNPAERDKMLMRAIEVVTKGAKANRSAVARRNGAKGGRKRKWSRKQVEAAAPVWFDVKLSGDDLDKALRRGRHPPRHYLQKHPPTGLGPRFGPTGA
jgi:hypothetical protein